MRGGTVQRPSGDMAPERFSFQSPIDALHDAVVGVQTAGVQDGNHARTNTFVLVNTGVKRLKRLPVELLPGRPKHVAQVFVAVNNHPVAGHHQAHGGHVKSQVVVDRFLTWQLLRQGVGFKR